MEQIKNRFFDTTADFSKSSLLSRDCLAKTDSLNYYDITLKSDEKAFIHQIRHAKKRGAPPREKSGISLYWFGPRHRGLLWSIGRGNAAVPLCQAENASLSAFCIRNSADTGPCHQSAGNYPPASGIPI